MNRNLTMGMCAVLLILASGCTLREIRSDTKFGPSFRHKGSNRTNSVRWSVEQGFDFKWSKGINTGISFRRRDTDEGTGDNDNTVFFDVSFPIWKAEKKPNPLKKRLKKLERRVAELESMLAQSGEH